MKNSSRILRGICITVAATMLSGCGAGASRTSGAAAATTAAAATAAETEAPAEVSYGFEGVAEESMEYDSTVPAPAGVPRSRRISGKYQAAYVQENFNAEEYSYISENGYKNVAEDPLSTFSVDVDTASYGNIRRMLQEGSSIPADAVRIEEMINYFHYDYPKPEGEEPFSVTTEYTDCPWNEEHRLLMIGLQAKKIDFDNRPLSNLVFLLDVSGSMYSDDKLPLVQKAFAMLVDNLDQRDRVSIVTYAGYESVVLDGVPGNKKRKIVAALQDLEAGGFTAGEAGIEKAYELAEKNFIPGGNNRVILATDGDLNVGISSESGLIRLIKEKKKSGVHLSVLGVGTGNIKDNKMEALADNGNGNYNYLDSLYEAKKVLVDEMGGTLITVAKDVKIQVEFNPEYVAGYRLVGYENRLLRNEDFNNDRVDAGEIGAGHTVTALYEIIPGGAGGQTLKYQTSPKLSGSSELLNVSLRYKAPNGDKSKLMEHPVEADSYCENMSEDLMFASAVAEFGMVLRDSENRGSATLKSVMELAESCVHADSDDYRKEFLELVQLADRREGGE
ncbi:MAG: VWA domain-containing protein [Lachnospiraceae bacterium]|nr:VWA domain-containing protein [Lachnospiraceae bacterium]